ncbi:hypothetical protein OG782_23360 [Streptomyces sp. NBC_00876]|uniref:hypothetical protein n=1 Tax=Streptomyces sp. NBC_00876 TaxID=2975853 RepID=UPI003865CC19|nr:hypothetical protein OG782_23360 [Streptomyces sp. NBC_00876]
MADEQYAWLDKEAAEKMLRREPVDPADGCTREDAERLEAALDAVARAARPATGELPGEAAALAAFRAVARPAARTAAGPARAGRAASTRTAGPADGRAESGMLAPVHIGRAAPGAPARSAGSRGARPIRWSRPIRFGLVASLACCAIGGVAVAAGTGVLPGPFGRHTPTPATSVSAAASPEELGSGLAPDDETTAPPPASSGPGTASPETPVPGRTAGQGTDRPGPTGQDGTGDDRADAGDHPEGGTTDSPPDGTGGTGAEGGNGKPDTTDDDDTSAAWYAKTLKACRDYRDGKLDADRKRRLEALAKGARNLDRFCDRILAKDGDDRGGDSDAGPGNGNGSGTLPSIGFTPAPEPSSAAVAPDPGTAEPEASQSAPAAFAAAR